MVSVRPLPLPDTASKAGYDHIDPLTQWFLGGDTAPAATATGISDDNRYGLDLANSGVGQLTFRAVAGSNFARINASGVAFGGTFNHTGSASISGSLTVANLTVTTGATIGNGLTVSTGATLLGGALTVTGAVTMQSSLNVSGAATVASTLVVGAGLAVAGAATVGSLLSTGAVTVNAALNVTGSTTFSAGVTMLSTLNVAGTATMGASNFTGAVVCQAGVTIASTLNVTGASTLNSLTVLSTSDITGAATFRSSGLFLGALTAASLNVTGAAIVSGSVSMAAALTIAGAVSMASTLNVAGAISRGGITVSRIAIGTYTGDGAGSQTIAVGFTASLVLVKMSESSFGTLALLSAEGTSAAHVNGATTTNISDPTVGISGTNFVAGGAAGTNFNTRTYRWVAIG